MVKNNKENKPADVTPPENSVDVTPPVNNVVDDKKNLENSAKIEPKEEMVEVPKSVLDAIIEKQKKQDDEITRLNSVADVGRLSKYDSANNNKELIHTAKISTWKHREETLLILAWKMVKDDVGVDTKGVLHEIQTIRLYLDSGKMDAKTNKPVLIEEDVDYLYFARNSGQLKGDIIKKSTGQGGDSVTLKFEDGRELEISTTFIN